MKKIMFNDKFGLTQAVLEGRKTQTRRIIPKDFFSLTWDEKNGTLWYENSMSDFIDVRNSKYALYKVCEVVAVAQSYKECLAENPYNRAYFLNGSAGWNNKMFVAADMMIHQIRITDVKIERIQDISDEDCIKEGVRKVVNENGIYVQYYVGKGDNACSFENPREAFAHIINKVSKKDVWNENLYVFVYEFELVK